MCKFNGTFFLLPRFEIPTLQRALMAMTGHNNRPFSPTDDPRARMEKVRFFHFFTQYKYTYLYIYNYLPLYPYKYIYIYMHTYAVKGHCN
jgi:hypothetical protein